MGKFKVKDFNGSGQYLILNRAEPNKFTDSSGMSTIMVKIGYKYSGVEGKHTRYIIAMSDGLIYSEHVGTKDTPESANEALVKYLNNLEDKFRFATQEEVVRVVMCQSGRWKS